MFLSSRVGDRQSPGAGVRDELKEGEQILVKVINIDPTGKIRLSRKALLQHEETGAGVPKTS